MHRERSAHIAVLVVVAAAAFGAGAVFGTHEQRTVATQAATSVVGAPAGVDLTPVWKAWNLLDQEFVPATTTHPVTPQDRVWGLISGLANAYNDPYTVFMPPREAQSFDQEISGSFGGVGIEIGMRNGAITVIAPLKDTPGDKAGIRTGDIIVAIDGTSTRAMTIDDAIDTIRGEIGTQVVLTVAREGEQDLLRFSITRANIDIPTVDTALRDDGIFVISLYNFGGTAEEDMRKAMRAFLASGSKKLVLDLRGNPGGYLQAAVNIAGWFLPVGDTVVTEDFGGGQPEQVHRSKGPDVVTSDMHMAVLVDGGSASASEILSGALEQHHAAVLIGSQTFGKGCVQEVFDITPDTSLKVTIARWLTPDGTSISDNGLTPDLVVPMTNDDVTAGRDPQLDAAVHYLTTGELVAPATTTATTTATQS